MSVQAAIRAQVFFYAVCVLATLAVSHWLHPSPGAIATFSFAAILISIWHGAYDHVLAEPAFAPRYGSLWLPLFVVEYVLLVLLTIGLWHISSAAALGAFLLYSAWHFGSGGERSARRISGVARLLAMGLLPIAACCHWHFHQVSAIFSSMLNFGVHSMPIAPALAHAAGVLLWPSVAVLLCTLVVETPAVRRSACWRALAVPLHLLLFSLCSPLAAFAVYFCCWHTPEHLLQTATVHNTIRPSLLRDNLKRGLLPWLASLAAIAIAFLFLNAHTPEPAVPLLFVALSALTVPHMLLGDQLALEEREIQWLQQH